jgi:hypothetical protein
MSCGILKFRDIDGSIIGDRIDNNIMFGGSKEEEQKEYDMEDVEFDIEGLVYENLDKKVIENREKYDYLVINLMEYDELNNKINILMRTNKDYFLEEIKPFFLYLQNIKYKKYIYDRDVNYTKEYIETIIDKVINFNKYYEAFKIKKDKENEEIKKAENEIIFLKHYKIKKKKKKLTEKLKSTTTEELDIDDIIKPKEESIKEESIKEESIKEEPKKQKIKGGKKEKDTKKKIEEEYFTEESLLKTIEQNKLNNLEQELTQYDKKDKEYTKIYNKIYGLKNKKKINKRKKLNKKNGITKMERLEIADI